MAKIKMRVKDGCRYMVNNNWYQSGDIVSVESGVASPNLVTIKQSPKVKPKPKVKPSIKAVEL